MGDPYLTKLLMIHGNSMVKRGTHINQVGDIERPSKHSGNSLKFENSPERALRYSLPPFKSESIQVDARSCWMHCPIAIWVCLKMGYKPCYVGTMVTHFKGPSNYGFLQW